MQHFDEDMDDLFRNASENYPLKIMEDNWEAIAESLAFSGAVSIDSGKKKRNGKRRGILFLAALGFLVLGSSVFMLISKSSNHKEGNKSSHSAVTVKRAHK